MGQGRCELGVVVYHNQYQIQLPYHESYFVLWLRIIGITHSHANGKIDISFFVCVSIYVINDGRIFPQKEMMEERTSTLCTGKQYQVKFTSYNSYTGCFRSGKNN